MKQQQDVMIALKNGQTRFGLLLNKVINNEIETWNFIDYSNLKTYTKTKNENLVEILDKTDIKFIDLDMR